jgi:hypothetical protein
MGAGAGADDQKKRILNFAMQPDDPGEAAKNFSLSALA